MGLLVIKAGFVIIFCASFVLTLYQRGMIHGLSLPIIIPSMEQIGIPFAQNDDANSGFDEARQQPMLDSTANPPGVMQGEDATAIALQETSGVPSIEMPVAEGTPVAGEMPDIPQAEIPGLMPEDLDKQIPLLPWVQTLSDMCSPIEGVRLEELPTIVSSPYKPPPPGSDERHMGVDFVYFRRDDQISIDGKEVYALLPGKVISVINDRIPYGNLVIIETRYSDVSRDLAESLGITPEQSLYHLYGHMKYSPPVVLGQRVPCGFQIGNVGNSGTQVPHLHLETRWGPVGGWFPAMGFLGKDTSEDEKANYLYWRISGVYQHFDPLDLVASYLNFTQQKK